MDAYAQGRTVDEPDITGRLVSAIEESVNAYSERSRAPAGTASSGIDWHAMTLRSGPYSAAHEKEFGADILGVLSIQTHEYRLKKGFLAQAKRAEPGVPFSPGEWWRLTEQCKKMLAATPDAFVVVYSIARGVRLVSAQAVVAYDGRDIFDLYDLGLRTFFERHLESFIGDPRLNEPTIDALRQIVPPGADVTPPAAYVIHLKARTRE